MNIYTQRLSRVRTAMNAHGLDTLVLTPGAAMRYLTGFSEHGFERLLCLVVPDDRDLLFLTPALNAAQTRANPAQIADVRVWDDGQGWAGLLSEVGKELALDIGIVGLDDEMPARFVLRIGELLPTALLKSAAPAFANVRAQKDAGELASLQHAADATDALIAVAFAACTEGASEMDVALAITSHTARMGSTASFEPIVAAGANGASPHHHTGKSVIKQGDVMVLDFGAKADGYCGDITRVVAVGHATDEARRVYDVVYRAYRAGVDAVRPGATGHDVDAAARKVITDAGYGEFFIHRTGHGIGLDDHEPPNMVAGNRTPLAPGNCFSIEPGIYLPGKFGVRLENIVTVQDDGTARVFNQSIAPELPILEN